MDGNRLDLYFNKGKMDHAVVSGKAQSTYFYVKKDRTVSGKNEAAGDTINILFDPIKNAVKTLRLLGRGTIASGRYVDLEKESRKKAEKEQARRDSLAKAGIVETATVSDSVRVVRPAAVQDSSVKLLPKPRQRKSNAPVPMRKILNRAKKDKKEEKTP